MKNFLLKFKYLLIGLGLAIAGTVYAVNVTIPQSTQKGDIPIGNANGTYNAGHLIAGTNITIDTSTIGSILISAGGVSGVTNSYASSTFPSFTYASSTYYLASNPNSYITLGSLSGSSPITYNNTTGAIGFNGSGYVGNAYASSTFINYGYGTSTFVTAVSASGNIASSGGLTPNITFTGVLPVASGGTGTSTAPTLQGQVLADDGVHKYMPTSLLAGTNVTIDTSTPGQILISASGSSGVSNLYASSTFVSFGYGSSTYSTLAYASSTFTNYGYGTATFATILNYPTYTYGSSTYVGFNYASSTFGSYSYNSSTFQTVLTNPLTGTGTNGQVPYFTGNTSLSSTAALLYNGSVFGMNATSSTIGFNIQGTAGTNDIFNIASSSTTSILKVTSAAQVLIAPTARLTIPQGTAPTLSAAGDIAQDTTNDQLLYGSQPNVLTATSTKTMTIVNPTATEDDDFGYFDVPITIIKVTCSVRNQNTSSVTFGLWHGTDRSGAGKAFLLNGSSCTGTTTPSVFTSFTDNTLAAGEMLVATTSAATLASTTSITIFYKYDRQ